MDRSGARIIFVCQQCGRESPKWLGRCPDCQEWNSFVQTAAPRPSAPGKTQAAGALPQELAQVTTERASRLSLPLAEFNRVLGGGIVPGSLVLIGGDPGIGKSTLLLEVSAMATVGRGKVLYVSGEESLEQIKLRADRLGIRGEGLYLLAETDLEAIIGRIEELSPSLVTVDSIQTVCCEDLAAAPGSVAQVRECTLRLMRWAKANAVPVLIAGHVTKDGAIAGPRTLEHIVDVVLYLEGEPFSAYRLLRGVKNRYGSTNEVGIFEMRGQGLVEVDNPSQAFLSQRRAKAVGSVVVPSLEGTRPLMVEIQALTTPTAFGLPRRTANGVDYGRLLLIAAVLSKRCGLALASQDIIANAVGGLRVSEPAADLGIALAIASSFRNVDIEPDLAAVGEVGLSGELRPVSQLERRLAEAARLGFKGCLAPRPTPALAARDIEIIEVSDLGEALRRGLSSPRKVRAERDEG